MSSQALTVIQAESSIERIDWDERRRLFAQAVARQATPAQVDVVIAICRELGMNPLTNHINLIDGQAYITHKGLLHVAHRSGQLNGIVIESQCETDTHYTATVSVYRKDMGHAFTYPGRYPKAGRNKAYGPEMALTRAETMAMRRAFDVALGVMEELNDPSDALRPAQQSATVRVLPTQSQSTIVDVAAEGLDATEFQTLRDTLSQMSDDGMAASEMVAFVKSQKEILSPDQLNQLRRDYKRLVDGRTESAAPQAIIVDATPAIVTSAPTLDLAAGEKPAKPAHLEAIKSLCAMKAIPLAEALAKAGATDLAALTQPQAQTVIDWLQREMPREAAV